MMYYAQYTVLINGATWDSHDYEFEADSNEKAVKIALDYEYKYIRICGDKTEELLLDYIYDENGDEIEH